MTDSWVHTYCRQWPAQKIVERDSKGNPLPASVAACERDLRAAWSRPMDAPDTEEVRSACVWMATEGRRRFAPGLRDIAVAIRARRSGERAVEQEAENCAACRGKGWLDVAPGLAAGGFGFGGWADAYVAQVPCTCHAGRAAWGREYQQGRALGADGDRRMRDLQTLGIAQWQTRQAWTFADGDYAMPDVGREEGRSMAAWRRGEK